MWTGCVAACWLVANLNTMVRAQPSNEGPGEKATPHLRVVWYASADTLAPARPAGLIVEVSPMPGMRVYAPGQLGYIPVSLTLEPSPQASAGAAKLPEPVEHVFPPTGERSLVFDRPFRLEVPLSLAKGATKSGHAGADLTIRGTFEYQACDDAVCYRPVKIPMSWTFRIERKKK
jgi:DsbC/DsbD-like thiol-disulfide interchange protein